MLPSDRRLLRGVEALTGILMCGWSTGFFFCDPQPDAGSQHAARLNRT
jgi:hypothetical protein